MMLGVVEGTVMASGSRDCRVTSFPAVSPGTCCPEGGWRAVLISLQLPTHHWPPLLNHAVCQRAACLDENREVARHFGFRSKSESRILALLLITLSTWALS